MFRACLLDIVEEEPGMSSARPSNTVKEPCTDGWRVQLLDGACADEQSDLLFSASELLCGQTGVSSA